MLAPKQEELKQQEAASDGGRIQLPQQIVDTSPKMIIEFRNILKKIIWDSNKFALDLCAVLAKDERQWQVSRKLLMDKINETERAYTLLIQNILVQENSQEIRESEEL